MKTIQISFIFILYLLAGTHAIPLMRVSFLGFSTPYSILVFYIIMLIVLFKIIVDKAKIKFPPALFTAFMCYFFSIILSACFAKQLDWEVLFKWFFFPLMPICICLIGNRLKTIKYALILFMISGVCVFVYGVYGFVTWEVGDPLQHALGFFGITYEASTRNGDMLYLQSTFWILVAISLYAESVNKPVRILCGILAAMLALGLVLSLARGAWVSGAITVIAIIFMQHSLRIKHGIPQARFLKTKLLVIFLLIFSLIFVFLSTVGDEYNTLLSARKDSISTFSEEGGNSNLARYRLLLVTSQIAASHPLGVGVWNLKYHLDDFYISGLASAENVYFQIVAEQGLIGLVSYLFILIWTARRLYRFIIINKKSSDQWVGWSLMCILINWSAYGLFNIMIETLWYWLGMSLAVALANMVEARHRTRLVVKHKELEPATI